MQDTFIKHFRAERWLSIFILVHLIAWTFVPAFVRYNLPMDSIEGAMWGHQLEWGYDKNPFLNGWLSALAVYFSPQSGWVMYLFSQLSVAACFWAVFRLANQMLSPVYALISVMLLEGMQYYNFHAIDFNDNTLELSLWALTIYFFYQALRTTTRWPWVLTGLFAGLGVMAKYYTFALLAAMFLFLVCYPANRKMLRTLPPYLGLMVFLVIILPHTIWLFFHDFVTVRYMMQRTASEPTWLNHVFFPFQFSLEQLQVLLPMLALAGVLLIGKRDKASVPTLAPFDQAFLFYVGLGPFLLTLLLSFLSGIKLRAGWGMPLLSLWGMILLTYLRPHITAAKLYRFIATVFVLMGALLAGYSYSLIDSSDPSSANFPGREIAKAVTQTWHDTYHTPLAYVAGPRWVGGNIEFYSADHPAVFSEWNLTKAPWINIKEMEEKGAVFVWNISNNETLPEEIKNKFQGLTAPTIVKFAWHRDSGHLPPIQIGVAFLPPSST
ncbi:MAG: glycosyltransferase family 39 protein [Gammaproteobacteria bacterium]|nr:MAG: glycosyltransferase family 39 protein [Gammaproteobacteria bacterium]